MTRILTYNVHRCVGTDRRLDLGRIAAVIGAERPDIVALQEVDVGRARTGGVDQAQAIAARLGMSFRFHAALKVEEELYGDAILTALPERLIRAGPLPGHPDLARLEPRGALWVAIEVDGVELQVLNTHLGLVPREQALQAAAQTLSNQALKRDALDALVMVREGAPLASALSQKKRFPGLLSMFARLGEQTGQLPTMLERAARQLSTEVQRRSMHLATILEPLLIVVMGLVVMLIVLAVLMPIIQLNQWVK